MLNYIKSMKFIKNEQGNVLIMVASFITVLFAVNGAAIDFGITQLVQMKKQQASDIATLASAQILNKDTTDTNEMSIRQNTANRYYNLNFPPGYFGVETGDPSTATSYSYNKSTGDIAFNSGKASVKNHFISVTGGGSTGSIGVGADTKVNIPGKEAPDFDVTIVVDESGSTWTVPPKFSKSIIATEKEAILDMIDALFPDSEPYNPNLRFGLIGYTGAIMQASPLTAKKSTAQSYVTPLRGYWQNYDHYGLEAGYNMLSGVWNGYKAPKHCDPAFAVLKDGCTPKYVDAPPGSPKNWGGKIELNHCWITTDGKPVCIPERNTGVPAPDTLRSDGQKLSKIRHMVLISDGYIMEEPVPCPSGEYYKKTWADGETSEPGDTCKNYRAFTDMCKKIKDDGIILYVISFVSEDKDDVHYLKAVCASTPDRYYYAPDGDVLKSILSGIAKQVKSIRITE